MIPQEYSAIIALVAIVLAVFAIVLRAFGQKDLSDEMIVLFVAALILLAVYNL